MVKSGRKWVMDMFMGQFLHNVDEKGRIIIPSKLREQLSNAVVVTRGFDKCVAFQISYARIFEPKYNSFNNRRCSRGNF